MILPFTKRTFFGLFFVTVFALPLQGFTTKELENFHDKSTKAQIGLLSIFTGSISLSRLCNAKTFDNSYFDNRIGYFVLSASSVDRFFNTYGHSIDAALNLLQKPSDIAGSALEMDKSLAKELLHAGAQTAMHWYSFNQMAGDIGIKTADTAVFNKINQLVKARFPGIDQQLKRRIMRIISMAIMRYFIFKLQYMIVIDELFKSYPDHNHLYQYPSALQRISGTLRSSSFLEWTVDHVLTECAGAIVASLIDDTVKNTKAATSGNSVVAASAA